MEPAPVDIQEISFHLHWKWTAELCNFSSLDVLFFWYPFHVVDWINHFFLQTPGASDRFCSITLDKHAATSPSPKSPGFFAGKFPLSACQVNGIGWDLRSPFERCSHIETNSWLHLILSLWSTLEAWGGLWKVYIVYMFLGFVVNVMGQSPTRKVIGQVWQTSGILETSKTYKTGFFFSSNGAW